MIARCFLCLAALSTASVISGAEGILTAVQNYASFYNTNSTGTLDSFKSCFVPSERSNVYSLPSSLEKTDFDSGKTTVANSNCYGNICEVKYHPGGQQTIDYVILKQHNDQWYVSSLFTTNLHSKLQNDCTGRLQQLAGALRRFALLNNGKYPTGNNAAGWQELLEQKFIKSSDDYHCPHCNIVYNYIGGKNITGDPDTPLAWCGRHVENNKFSNVMLISGNIRSMSMTSAASTAGSGGAVALALQETRNSQIPAADNGKTIAPAHWLKGPTPDWYIHLEDAKAAARRTGRKIYALHTGSDWCPPCKRLEKFILSTEEFKKFARKNIILLFVDAPRRKPIPADQKKYNRSLAAQLNFGGGVPSILLLDSDGTPLTRIGGRRDTADHINAIRHALSQYK